MARIAVYIGTQQKRFLYNLAETLSEVHEIVLLLENPEVWSALKLQEARVPGTVHFRSDFTFAPEESTVIELARDKERLYGETLAMLLSQDRALGKGYLFNADRHPDMVRAWWPHKRKLREILGDLAYAEEVLERFDPQLLLGITQIKPLALVAAEREIPYVALQVAKFGNRYHFVDNEYQQNLELASALTRYLSRTDPGSQTETDFTEYEQVAESRIAHSGVKYTYASAFRKAASILVRDPYRRVREAILGKVDRKSYRYLGWLAPVFRRVWMHRYVSTHGIRPQDLSEYRTVYFPLHLEPEATLLSVSPEFNNSMEAIAWVSKALPADCQLVVKEQPFSFGIRSRHFYENLQRMANVVLAHPSVHSWKWIDASDLVVTFTGTVSLEAVYFRRPLLSFGRHQIVNQLPTVRFASDYPTTRDAVDALLAIAPDDPVFSRSRQALYKAQMETSFEIPGYAENYNQDVPQHAQARLVREELESRYAHAIAAEGSSVASSESQPESL